MRSRPFFFFIQTLLALSVVAGPVAAAPRNEVPQAPSASHSLAKMMQERRARNKQAREALKLPELPVLDWRHAVYRSELAERFKLDPSTDQDLLGGGLLAVEFGVAPDQGVGHQCMFTLYFDAKHQPAYQHFWPRAGESGDGAPVMPFFLGPVQTQDPLERLARLNEADMQAMSDRAVAALRTVYFVLNDEVAQKGRSPLYDLTLAIAFEPVVLPGISSLLVRVLCENVKDVDELGGAHFALRTQEEPGFHPIEFAFRAIPLERDIQRFKIPLSFWKVVAPWAKAVWQQGVDIAVFNEGQAKAGVDLNVTNKK